MIYPSKHPTQYTLYFYLIKDDHPTQNMGQNNHLIYVKGQLEFHLKFWRYRADSLWGLVVFTEKARLPGARDMIRGRNSHWSFLGPATGWVRSQRSVWAGTENLWNPATMCWSTKHGRSTPRGILVPSLVTSPGDPTPLTTRGSMNQSTYWCIWIWIYGTRMHSDFSAEKCDYLILIYKNQLTNNNNPNDDIILHDLNIFLLRLREILSFSIERWVNLTSC